MKRSDFATKWNDFAWNLFTSKKVDKRIKVTLIILLIINFLNMFLQLIF